MALTPREHQALRPLAPTREVYVQPWRENVERVREALTPRDHHRLCRVNMPTEWSRECNCPHDEVELDHVALDALTTQIEELEWERDEWRKDAKVWQEIAEKREDINLSSIPPVTEALHAMADTMLRAAPDYDPHIDHPERYSDGKPV